MKKAQGCETRLSVGLPVLLMLEGRFPEGKQAATSACTAVRMRCRPLCPVISRVLSRTCEGHDSNFGLDS